MQPLHPDLASSFQRINTILFDVDDTLTTDGQLTKEAIDALYAASDANFTLIAVTGRSAAWGEMLVRLFPLRSCIAETGALAYIWDAKRLRVLHSQSDEALRKSDGLRRQKLADMVKSTVPSARLALDNCGRIYDTAFDLVEDGPQISSEDAAQIRHILRDGGLTVAQSSVHINAWFGDFDKASMVSRVLDSLGQALDDTCVYIGDSKNDASMFKSKAISVGVHNVMRCEEELRAMKALPNFITRNSMGAGFAELVKFVIAERETTNI